VEQIISRRFVHGYAEYKCRWRGYAREDDTWEPLHCLLDSVAVEKVYLYERRLAHYPGWAPVSGIEQSVSQLKSSLSQLKDTIKRLTTANQKLSQYWQRPSPRVTAQTGDSQVGDAVAVTVSNPSTVLRRSLHSLSECPFPDCKFEGKHVSGHLKDTTKHPLADQLAFARVLEPYNNPATVSDHLKQLLTFRLRTALITAGNKQQGETAIEMTKTVSISITEMS